MKEARRMICMVHVTTHMVEIRIAYKILVRKPVVGLLVGKLFYGFSVTRLYSVDERMISE
jgi:hypothetical protein